MKAFQTTQKLDVYRSLNNGQKILTGQLAQNNLATYFQYNADYLERYHSLSPFNLPFNNTLHQSPARPHHGLHGAFADSLPDGWGLLLMDRIFRQQGILAQKITTMDRLAYIGHRGVGALSYSPAYEYLDSAQQNKLHDIAQLGHSAVQLFDGQTETVLIELANAGASAGARPKALIFFDPEKPHYVSTAPQKGLQAWLIKFTSQHLLLGHEEGLCEAAYLTMAKNAGIQVPNWQLIAASDNHKWLALKRFDCLSGAGRYHMQSLCGLLDADFRLPSIDYEDLIKASQILCQSPAVGKLQFIRALFNLFAVNQDDHSKNWSFLMDDGGQWQPSPCYDITFSPNPNSEHSTAFMGFGKHPPVHAIQELAKQANYGSWKEAQQAITQVVDAISQWPAIAKDLGISKKTCSLIDEQLNKTWQQNKPLLNN